VKALLLGLDVGTTACKALVDVSGDVIAIGERPTRWVARPTGGETAPKEQRGQTRWPDGHRRAGSMLLHVIRLGCIRIEEISGHQPSSGGKCYVEEKITSGSRMYHYQGTPGRGGRQNQPRPVHEYAMDLRTGRFWYRPIRSEDGPLVLVEDPLALGYEDLETGRGHPYICDSFPDSGFAEAEHPKQHLDSILGESDPDFFTQTGVPQCLRDRHRSLRGVPNIVRHHVASPLVSLGLGLYPGEGIVPLRSRGASGLRDQERARGT